MPTGLHAFVSDYASFCVLQCSKLDYGQAYLAYYRGLEVDWYDEACVGWFSYTHSSGKLLDISAHDEISAKRNVDDVQVKRLVRSVSVRFKARPRKAVAVRAAYYSLSGFPGPSEDIPAVENEIVKEDAPS